MDDDYANETYEEDFDVGVAQNMMEHAEADADQDGLRSCDHRIYRVRCGHEDPLLSDAQRVFHAIRCRSDSGVVVRGA